MNLARRAIELACLLAGVALAAIVWGWMRTGCAVLAATVLLLAVTSLVLADHVDTRHER